VRCASYPAATPLAIYSACGCPPKSRTARNEQHASATFGLEEVDFLQQARHREAIHRRERGRCFYCRRRVHPRSRVLDHVFPRAEINRRQLAWRNTNSYRNLVSCCTDCNSQKRARPAADFLRALYRNGRLNPAELAERLAALKALARGQLKPLFAP